jgi:hypothetical protein
LPASFRAFAAANFSSSIMSQYKHTFFPVHTTSHFLFSQLQFIASLGLPHFLVIVSRFCKLRKSLRFQRNSSPCQKSVYLGGILRRCRELKSSKKTCDAPFRFPSPLQSFFPNSTMGCGSSNSAGEPSAVPNVASTRPVNVAPVRETTSITLV